MLSLKSQSDVIFFLINMFLIIRVAMATIETTLEINIKYRQTSNIRRTFVCNIIVDKSDVVGASPVGAAPTTSPLST